MKSLFFFILVLFSFKSFADVGVLNYQMTSHTGLSIQVFLSGDKPDEGWNGVTLNGNLNILGGLGGDSFVSAQGMVEFTMSPHVEDGVISFNTTIANGTLTSNGEVCHLINGVITGELVIDANDQATLKMGSNQPTMMNCRGVTIPGFPLIPGGVSDTIPVLFH